MAISNDPNDPNFGLETDPTHPHFGLAHTPPEPIVPRSGAQMESLEAREFTRTAPEQVRGTGDQPVIPIPRVPQQRSILGQLGAGAVNIGAGVAEMAETPANIAALPVAPAKLSQILFAGQAFKDIGTAFEEARQPGTSIQKGLELGGRALTDALFGVGMARGAIEPAAPLTERAAAEVQPRGGEIGGKIQTAVPRKDVGVGVSGGEKEVGIPLGFIEEGINQEHPDVAAHIDRYSHSQEASGLTDALKHEDYEGYYEDLQRVLKRGYGDNPIPVTRVEGYEPGSHGKGVGDHISVSTNPHWGEGAAKRGAKVIKGFVNKEDVVAAGNEAEGELIIKKGSLKQGGEVSATKPISETGAVPIEQRKPTVGETAVQAQEGDTRQASTQGQEITPVSTEGQPPVVEGQPKTEGGVGEKEVQKDEGQGREGVLSEPAAGETPPSPAAAGVPAEQVPFIEGSPQVAGEVDPEQAAASRRMTATGSAEPIRVRPLAALKSVYQAAEKAGAAGYKRGLTEARAEGKAASAQIKGELSVADKWLAGDQEQVRQNMVDYVNKTLPPAERGRFVGAITRALRRPALQGGDPSVMYKNAFNVMKAIENRSEQVYKGGVIDDIKSTLTKSLESKSVDVQYRRGVKDFLDQISFTKPTKGTVSRLQSLQDFVDKERAAGREPPVPKEQLEQLSTLSKLPLQDMTTNALEKMRDEVENFVSLGKLKAKLQERAWTRSRETAIKELRASPSNPIETRPMYRPQPTERLTAGQKFMNVVKGTLNARLNFENAIAPMDEIYDHLDGARGTYDGWASKNIKGRLDLDRNKTISEWLPIKRQSDALIKKYGLKTADMQTVQIKGIIKMVGRERLEAMGVRPDIIDRLDKVPLTEGQQAYHDFIRKQYDAVGTRIQDVAHRLYQQDMQIVPDYMPLERDWAANSEREPPEPMADPSIGEIPFNETATMNQLLRDVNPKILSRTEQGFLKDRLEGAKTAVKLDANEVFERHMQDALHFVNSHGNLKMLGEIVRRPEFEKKFGKAGQNIVLDHLDTVANQGYVNHMQRVRWLDWVRNSTSKGAIGFRVASNFVHTSQLPIAAYHAGGAQWWSKGLQLALSEKGQNWLRQNAAETYVRGGGEPAQVEVEAFSKFGRAGFFVARNIDKYNAQATLLGRYAKEMQKSGVSVDNVLDAPVNTDLQGLALRRMHRAVASPQSKDIPQMTSRGAFVGGNVSVARALNQFRNIFLDNWSNVRHDMLRVGVGDADRIVQHLRAGEIAAGAREVGDAGSHRAAIAAAMLMSVAMETGIKLGTKKGIESGMAAVTGVEPTKRKEEETYLGDLQHHLINRIPFAGQLYTAAVYGETGVPTIDAILAPLHEAGQVIKSKTPETQAKHVVRAASAAGTVLGIPGSSQVLEAGQPAITKAIAPLIPDRSKGRVAGGSKEPVLMQ